MNARPDTENAPKQSQTGVSLPPARVRRLPWALRRQHAAGTAAPPRAIASGEFVAAMRNAVNGVSVVTTDGIAGRYGLTVSTLTSVSAQPPLLLACINRGSPLLAALLANGGFAASLLGEDQREVADTFAGRAPHGAAFDFGCGDWTVAVTGAPLLHGAPAAFDCTLAETYAAGTHAICLGRVVAAHTHGGTHLLYTAQGYGRPAGL